MRADLHVHSNASDGTDPPGEVIRRAALAGLDAVALTDHDTVAGHEQAREALLREALPREALPRGALLREALLLEALLLEAPPQALTLVPGLELSCQLDGHSLHLLAYLFDPGEPELAQQTRRIRDDRERRARAMVRALADLGVAISWDQVAAIAGTGVVGRPHIARALVASGAIAEPGQAFTHEWIGEGGRAYVGRYALDPVGALRMVREAGGVTVLAHPRAGRARLSDEQIAGLAAAGLDGVEVFHPDQSAAERAGLLALVRDLGLVATGGSDDHGRLTGHRIGCELTAGDAYQALVSKATGANPISRDKPVK